MTPETLVSSQRSTAKSDTAFAVDVAVLFACVCGFAISYHEMWRDEMQSWLMSRSTRTLAELRDAIRYEGHPALWYLLLYGLTRLTQRPEAMQIPHVVIGSACAFVFARSAPFPRWGLLGDDRQSPRTTVGRDPSHRMSRALAVTTKGRARHVRGRYVRALLVFLHQARRIASPPWISFH